jgi:hypothetical protein
MSLVMAHMQLMRTLLCVCTGCGKQPMQHDLLGVEQHVLLVESVVGDHIDEYTYRRAHGRFDHTA